METQYTRLFGLIIEKSNMVSEPVDSRGSIKAVPLRRQSTSIKRWCLLEISPTNAILKGKKKWSRVNLRACEET